MKLSHRIAVITTGIFLLLLVVFFIDNELQYAVPNDGENDLHGKQHYMFHRRFLNRDENSRVSGEAQNHPMNVMPLPPQKLKNVTTSSTEAPTTQEPRDEFLDLYKYSTLNPDFRKYMEWPPYFRLPIENPTLGDHLKIKVTDNMTNWEKFHLQISKYYMYPEDANVVNGMLNDMAKQKIVGVVQLPGGTQIKLLMTFENGAKALFKPMRFPREVETLPNHFYFTDFERHVSEIASYHLDKILGFRRAPPVIGRKVNISEEIYPLAEPELHKTFFISPAGNVCFHGQCSYYCDTGHAVCGDPDMVEGSLSAWLPANTILHRRPVKSPWRRSYNKRRKASWESDNYYCITQVKPNAPYDFGRRLYDVMDLAIFDFLTGNMDRHHYDEFTTFGNDSTIIHWDHGRGFGRASVDEESLLMPLLQCCTVRLSTFNRLLSLHIGPKRLSDLMRESMADDPVAPVLTEPHLLALDRRVDKVLQGVRKCMESNQYQPWAVVLLDDMDYIVKYSEVNFKGSVVV